MEGNTIRVQKLPGGGAMGATLGNLEFSSQTNNNADSVPEEDRFKWVDDLTVLEKINLVNIGLTSYNFKEHVASDIPIGGFYLENKKLKTQGYIDDKNYLTVKQKMELNQNKTKAMLINYTHNFQFSSRLKLKGVQVEFVNTMKILGVVINSQLTWDDNTKIIVKKVNQRLQLLWSVLNFGSTIPEMVHLWKVYCLSILEQSCVVWGSSISEENKEDLERTQKYFAKLVLKDKYKNYNSALWYLNLEKLSLKREKLMIRFGKSSIENKKLHKLPTIMVNYS